MKTKLTLIALLISFSITAQKKITFIGGDTLGVNINYINEAGQSRGLMINSDTLTGANKIIFDNYISFIKSQVNAQPKGLIPVSYVKLSGAIFAITGQKPDGTPTPPALNPVAELSNTIKVTGTNVTQKQAYDNFSSFILSYTGNVLSTLDAPFGTKTVIVNGTTYSGLDYDAFMQDGGANVLIVMQLCSDLLNQ